MLHCAMPCHAMACYALPRSSTPCHAALTMHRAPSRDHCPARHPTARIEGASTPWQGIGGRGRTSDMTRAHPACPYPFPPPFYCQGTGSPLSEAAAWNGDSPLQCPGGEPR
eukprot:9218923-Pyramimonas_sp.AAC.1